MLSDERHVVGAVGFEPYGRRAMRTAAIVIREHRIGNVAHDVVSERVAHGLDLSLFVDPIVAHELEEPACELLARLGAQQRDQLVFREAISEHAPRPQDPPGLRRKVLESCMRHRDDSMRRICAFAVHLRPNELLEVTRLSLGPRGHSLDDLGGHVITQRRSHEHSAPVFVERRKLHLRGVTREDREVEQRLGASRHEHTQRTHASEDLAYEHHTRGVDVMQVFEPKHGRPRSRLDDQDIGDRAGRLVVHDGGITARGAQSLVCDLERGAEQLQQECRRPRQRRLVHARRETTVDLGFDGFVCVARSNAEEAA